MMEWLSFEQTAEGIASSISIFWVVLKWVYVLAFGVYVVFSFVILAQVKQMIMALSGGFEKGLKLLAWGNLALAFLAFLTALVVL